ncbi:MAG: DUF4956 domain-containing protein [Phycisphaerae bacterium]|jgi:uncharacterized membrane protein YhiD involved in acid resistance
MDSIWQAIETVSSFGSAQTTSSIILSVILSFVFGQLVAWLYYFTHTGVSYSRSFVQSLILITVVVSLVMNTIAGSFVVAVGLMGALSIIRFRNMIKDTRDIAFIFMALVLGMACGSQRFRVAIIGAVALTVIVLYLYFSEFGSHRRHNAFLRFNAMSSEHAKIEPLLKKYCSEHTLISSHKSDWPEGSTEYSYQIMVKNIDGNEKMLAELETLEGIDNIYLSVQEQLLQI